MLSLILAIVLQTAPVAHAETSAMTALYEYHGARAERHTRAGELGRWLDSLDGERIRAAAAYSPFADDDNANPFEE